MKSPFFSIFIPSYNNSATILDTLNSVFKQKFTNFEIIVRDDCSKDNTVNIIKSCQDSRLKIFINPKNLGYSGNLNTGIKDCKGKYVFLLAGDDLIDHRTLKWYYEAIKSHPQAGAITRPYYWFESDYTVPIRAKKKLSSISNKILTTNSSFKLLFQMFSTLDQLSALCLRRKFIDINFSQEPWISHAYPWLSIFKNHSVIFLNKYPLAVRIGNSATRTNIYQKSPMVSWKNMIETIFFENKFKKLKNKIISEFISTNYIGLIQIRNYGDFSSYLREVRYLISFRYKNVLNPIFWGFLFITFLTPPLFLRKISDHYKSHINSKLIPTDFVIKI
jgi:glycosyltransferase involved in cell wall biosynthesis